MKYSVTVIKILVVYNINCNLRTVNSSLLLDRSDGNSPEMSYLNCRAVLDMLLSQITSELSFLQS